MTKTELKAKLLAVGYTEASDKLVISSNVVRVHDREGLPTIGIATEKRSRKGEREARSAKAAVDAVADGLYWVLKRARGEPLRVVLPAGERQAAQAGAIKSLLAGLAPGAPEVRLDWRLAPAPATRGGFGDVTKWMKDLDRLDDAPTPAAAQELEAKLRPLGFRWYGAVTSPQRLSGRLRGLEVCSGREVRTKLEIKLQVGKKDEGLGKEFEDFRKREGLPPATFDLGVAEGALRRIARERADGHLKETQPEHELESRILAGEEFVALPDGRRLGPIECVRPFQFPARFCAEDKRRHIDLLMAARGDSVPWVVELKAGSEGEYLRHAITQAVLYREFVKGAKGLHRWFSKRALDASKCRAAVALPSSRKDLFGEAVELGRLFAVEVVKLG